MPSARPKSASRVCTVPPTSQISANWVAASRLFSRLVSCPRLTEHRGAHWARPHTSYRLESAVRRLSQRRRMIGCCTCSGRHSKASLRFVVRRVAIQSVSSPGQIS